MNTAKNRRPFFSTEDFLRIAAPFKSKIAGKLPKDFLGLFPEKPSQVFDFIDELADYTREQPFSRKEKRQLKLSSNKEVIITYLGQGRFGNAFNLGFVKSHILKFNPKSSDFGAKNLLGLSKKNKKKVFHFLKELTNCTNQQSFKHGEQRELSLSSKEKILVTHQGETASGYDFKFEIKKDYDLKVFKKPYMQIYYRHSHGAVAEARTGLYLCSEDYCDLLKFHIANFDDEKRWQIAEYLDKDKDFSEKRPGKNIREAHPELIFGDNISEAAKQRNEINNIILDLGGIKKKGAITPSPIIEKTLNPIFYNFSHYQSFESRKQAFYDLLNNANSETRKELSNQIYRLQEDDRKDAFYAMLNHTDPEARKELNSQIADLKKEDIKDAFYASLNHPDFETKKGLHSQIEYLKIGDQKQAEIDLQKKIEESLKTFSIVKN